MIFLAAEHFTRAPNWEWYILGYFFLAGISGGSYVLGTLLRLRGGPGAVGAARVAFVAALLALLLCPLLLTIDLGRPERFWHMLLESDNLAPVFKYWSPMSMGAYALTLYGLFCFVSAVEAFMAARGSRALSWFSGGLATAWNIVGSVFALYIAAYTGVLLAVSNQPVWSDGWPLGGLFLASGLSGAAALLMLLARWRPEVRATLPPIEVADRYFVLLEAIFVVVFLVTVAAAGTLARLFFPVGIVLWILVLVGLALPWVAGVRSERSRQLAVLSPLAVLLGVLALRAVVIFGAQT